MHLFKELKNEPNKSINTNRISIHTLHYILNKIKKFNL